MYTRARAGVSTNATKFEVAGVWGGWGTRFTGRGRCLLANVRYELACHMPTRYTALDELIESRSTSVKDYKLGMDTAFAVDVTEGVL